MTDRSAWRILYGACVVVAIALFACVLIRAARWTYGADAGTFYQIIIHSFSGMTDGVEHGTHWRFHCSPTLVLLWPILAAFPSLITLQSFSIVAILACTPLVYAVARLRLSPGISLRLAMIALLYPPLLANAFLEFHELVLFPALAIGAALALARRRYAWYAVCAVLAIGVREDVSMEIAIVSLALAVYWLARDRARAVACIATCAASLAVLGVYYGIVIPHVGAWPPSHFYVYPFASSPTALVAAIFTDPGDVIRATFTFGRLTYLLEAFVPLLFLPVRSWALLLALPGFAIVLLANSPEVWRMGEHYAALWIPWMLIATVLASARIAPLRTAFITRWLHASIIVSALALIFVNPMHPAHYLQPGYDDISDARRALQCIPRDAGIDTQDEWYSAIVATHPHATIGDLTQPYALFASDFPNHHFAMVVEPQIASLVARGRLVAICTDGRVVAYRNAGSTPSANGALRRTSNTPP